MLYGRSGYLLGCLLLDRHLSAGSLRVTDDAIQMVVQAVFASGGWKGGPFGFGHGMSRRPPVTCTLHHAPVLAALPSSLHQAPHARASGEPAARPGLVQAGAWPAACATVLPSPPRSSSCGPLGRMPPLTWVQRTA